MNDTLLARYRELLVDQCTVGLDAAAQLELIKLQRSLTEESPEFDWQTEADSIALAAAAVDRAYPTEPAEPLPAGLDAAVLQAMDNAAEPAGEVVELSAQQLRRSQSGQRNRAQWLGWYAAAAALVAVIYLGMERVPTDSLPSVAEQRASLLQQADVEPIAWAPPTVSGYQQVSGDVVWDNATQQGFMRLVNLPVNDPAKSQYQLWIVDPERDQHPVDGGVFDVTESGEVIVPIDSKLPIISPAAFAITREQPGGVVVSAGPLLVVAAVEA